MSTATSPPPPIKRLRGRVATTPDRLRVAMADRGRGAARRGPGGDRRDGSHGAAPRRRSRRATSPSWSRPTDLYATLADADATAAATFLAGGLESPARRQRYLSDVRRASLQLTALSQRVQDSPQAARAIAAIAASLPVYSGLVETARANNRQGFPVGAAYLRDASDLMRGRILAAAGDLYRLEARRLSDHQAAATRPGGLTRPWSRSVWRSSR